MPGADAETDEQILRPCPPHRGHHVPPHQHLHDGHRTRRRVVDPELRVHGIEELRVIDASIMPTVVSGNTNAAAIMIGEKGADLVLRGAHAQTAPERASAA